ncbi:hypothetical protein JW887_07075 [Candidatus Dojkabacteria bacterium]|nr:hypothetical protein [Candidatus Dojkabacteria bacterium]
MKSISVYAIISFIASGTAFLFLIYSLVNIKRLGISITHPRVIVEFSIFFIGLIVSLLLIKK